jgi:hypothetical protein
MATSNNSNSSHGRKVPTDIVTVIDLAREVGLHPSNVQKDLRRLDIEVIKQSAASQSWRRVQLQPDWTASRSLHAESDGSDLSKTTRPFCAPLRPAA